MNYDTIVIGAGLAGMMAALGQAEQGRRVLVLAKGHGATHWATGCIDLHLTPGTANNGAAANPQATVEELIANEPEHPYALVGMAGIEEGLQRLRQACEASNYPLAGDLRRNVLLPTAAGALRPTCLLPLTMVAGDIRTWPTQTNGAASTSASLLVVGFHELRDFFPPLIAANLRAQGFAADPAYIEIPPGMQRRDYSTMIFARQFDNPQFRAEIGRQLRGLVRRGRYTHVALPAVLGMRYPLDVVSDLQAASGALVFEVPTLPSSVPGIRLYTLLSRAVEQAGGRIQIGSEVLGGAGSGNRLDVIFSEAAARRQEHRAARFILATGGIAGGGIASYPDGRFRETALNLPVRGPNARSDWFAARYLDAAGHPVFRAGIAVDQQFRPRDAAGQVVYENVQVAGVALPGVDPIHEGCYEGLAVTTGWAVGKM